MSAARHALVAGLRGLMPEPARQSAVPIGMTRAAKTVRLRSIWTHPAYGRAVVVMVSSEFSTGRPLVTVQYDTSGSNVFPAEFCTCPLEEFSQRFTEVTP